MQARIRLSLAIGVALLMLGSYSPHFFPPAYVPVTGERISYSRDIQPILDSRCITCHGVQKIRNGLDLRTYASLMAGSKNGAVIIPGDAQKSLLIQKIEAGEMPKRGPKLFPAQLHKLMDWINAGALDT